MRFGPRFQRVSVGVGSLATIILLLAGVPVALWSLAGSPLPAGMPSVAVIVEALTRKGLSDSTLIKIVAAVGWVVWLQAAASIIVEILSWVRGLPAPHLRFAGPIQPIVRKLIASAALVVNGSAAYALPSPITIAARPLPAVAAAFDHISFDLRTSHGGVVEPASPSSTPGGLPSYTVVRYDTLWGLAEQHLGDPLRWRELFELNKGRRQADAGSLTDPDLIRVGWRLVFPADAVGLERATAPWLPPVPTQPAPPPIVQPTEPSDTVGDSSVPPRSPTIPTPSPVPSASASMPPRGHASLPTNPNSPNGSTNHQQSSPIPWPLVGGGLTAAGLVTLLSRLRRVRQRHRPPDSRPCPPTPELEQIERRLRHVADPDAATFLNLSLRAFATGAHDDKAGPPQILAVRLAAEKVELLLASTPRRPPKGFVITDNERGWISDPDLDIEDLRSLAAGTAAPFPSLVNVGDLDGEQILIDLETAGVLTVDGASADAFLTSIVLQLATGTWIDHVDVILVASSSRADVAAAARVRRVPDLESAINELAAIARSFEQALDSSHVASTLHARFSDQHDDGWIPTVLVSTEPLEHSAFDQLCTVVAGGGRGVAAVVKSDLHSVWHASVDRDHLVLQPLGFDLTPSMVDADSAELIDQLLTDAAVSNDFEQPGHNVENAHVLAVTPYEDPPFEVEVRILGPVEIGGIAAQIERRRAEELVTYLALHPKGASEDRIKTVLWRDKAPTDGTFNTTVSFARTSLGLGSDGNPHFPHYSAAGHTYRLGPTVTSDVARFEARVAHAKRCNPENAIATLRSALELVRGTPFEDSRGYEWAFSESIVAAAEATIADAPTDSPNSASPQVTTPPRTGPRTGDSRPAQAMKRSTATGCAPAILAVTLGAWRQRSKSFASSSRRSSRMTLSSPRLWRPIKSSDKRHVPGVDEPRRLLRSCRLPKRRVHWLTKPYSTALATTAWRYVALGL